MVKNNIERIPYDVNRVEGGGLMAFYTQNFPVHASPQRDPILSFSYAFSPKSTRVGGPCPTKTGPRPPATENAGSAPGFVIFETFQIEMETTIPFYVCTRSIFKMTIRYKLVRQKYLRHILDEDLDGSDAYVPL